MKGKVLKLYRSYLRIKKAITILRQKVNIKVSTATTSKYSTMRSIFDMNNLGIAYSFLSI